MRAVCPAQAGRRAGKEETMPEPSQKEAVSKEKQMQPGQQAEPEVQPAEQPGATTAPTAGLIERVARFYHKSLAKAQRARTWLKRHQLEDEHVIGQLLIGAANGKFLKALPSGTPQQNLTDLGILTPAGEEFFLDCVTLPLLDPEGGIRRCLWTRLASVSRTTRSGG